MDGGGTLVTTDVSSSLVRKRLSQLSEDGNVYDDGGWCIQGLVPNAVNSYIQRYHLYRDGRKR